VGAFEFNAAGLAYVVHTSSCTGNEYNLGECLKNVSLQKYESGLPASVTCQGNSVKQFSSILYFLFDFFLYLEFSFVSYLAWMVIFDWLEA